MILSSIYQAIFDRVKADTGTDGLYKSGAWNIISGAYSVFGTPAAITYPYLLVGVRLEQDHSLTADEWTATATFTVWDQVQNYASSADFDTRITAVMDRLHGNAVLQAGRIPTYGFHRHLLVLPTNGYTAKASHCFVRTYDATMTDEHSIQATMTATFRVSALAANP
jgi:hypothetical protein